MVFFFVIHLVLAYGYLVIIGWTATKWEKYQDTLLSKTYRPKNKFSIIIPFKDEETHIAACIQSLMSLANGSPIFEIVAVNDHSIDASKKVVEKLGVIVYDADQKGKKNALQLGIKKAKNPWIITVDADVTLHPSWLRIIDQHIQTTDSDVVVGPVKIKDDKSIITRFQIMDVAATMGITLAGIASNYFYLSNGANFIFKKESFDKVGGYLGNENIASGDDVFLLKKFSSVNSIKISFLKSERGAAITKAENSLKSLYLQRKRWATKTKAYANYKIISAQSFVFILSFFLILDFTLLPWFTDMFSLLTGIFLLFLKLTIDYLYLGRMVSFFREKSAMRSFIPTSLMYLIYILVVGFFALFPTSVEWKGRKI